MVRLTDSGRTTARSLIRTHRLWERFLWERLGLRPDHIHGTADRLEHFTSPAMMIEALARNTTTVRIRTDARLPGPGVSMAATIHIRPTARGCMRSPSRCVLRSRACRSTRASVWCSCSTSASLTIQENADPSARRDLEDWMERSVPEGQREFTHTMEGSDDMPSHIRAMLTDVSLSIPIVDGRLALGTWQGIYLFEHRAESHDRPRRGAGDGA